MAIKTRSELQTQNNIKIYQNVDHKITGQIMHDHLEDIIDSFDTRSSVINNVNDPTSTDDDYELGQIWINSATTPERSFMLVDNTTGAAVWKYISDVDAINNNLTGASIKKDIGLYSETSTYNEFDVVIWLSKFYKVKAGETVLGGTVNVFTNSPDINTAQWLEITSVQKYVFTSDPLSTDDTSSGYNIGDIVINSNTNNQFLCVDNTAGSAIWKKINNYETGDFNVNSGNLISQGINNLTDDTAIGINALNNTTGIQSIGIGTDSLKNNSGDSNIAVGINSGKNVSGNNNIIIGTNAGENIASNNNIAIGLNSMLNATSGLNTSVGATSMRDNMNGNNNSAFGAWALIRNVNGTHNAAMSRGVLQDLNDGYYNTGLGALAMMYITSGNYNTGIGAEAMRWTTTQNNTIAIGYQTMAYGDNNTNCVAIGNKSMHNTSNINNSVALGYNTNVSGNNQVQLGNSSTTTYAYGAVQDRSDIRDKADIIDTVLGLDFINMLRPVDYKWDYREDYTIYNEIETGEFDNEGNPKKTIEIIENIKDGSKKRTRNHHGFIAQEIEEIINNTGVDFGGFQDHSINGGEDIKSIGYQELIAPMVKAIQELTIKNSELEARILALETK